LRQRLATAALRLAAAVDYTSVGTVSFLAPDGAFYFLEMNTRLQVEHAITEMVTGVDLVHQQLRVARGERLAYTQDQLGQRGHAIECRLYAEDAAQGFLPATGRITVLREPYGPGRRIDSGIALHDQITPYYDPLLAKLVSYGFSRTEAIARMQALLRDYTVLGVTTNRQFLLDVVSSKAFADGDTDTAFLERHFPVWRPESALSPEIIALAAVASCCNIRITRRPTTDCGPGAAATPRGNATAGVWGGREISYRRSARRETIEVDIAPVADRDDCYRVTVGENLELSG
jgi:acetyl/propionyl-CoA carboxylase alpha subunit